MKRRILAYLDYIDKLLEKAESEQTDDTNKIDWEQEIKKHLVQIAFFAHERLVHLIVMVLFALCTVGCILYLNFTGELIILALTIALLVLLIPYVMHYYLLENSVQKMYEQYDKMLSHIDEAFIIESKK